MNKLILTRNFINFSNLINLLLNSHILLSIFLGIIGLFIGSFANVVVLRLRSGENMWTDRSKCPKCEHQLSAWDLFPVFSWLFLRAKCRYCKSSISWQYPLVELIFGGLWFAVTWLLPVVYNMPSGLYLGLMLILFSLLLIIAVYDILYYEIPDQLSLPAIAVSLGFLWFSQTPLISSAITASILLYSFFYLQVFIPVLLYSFEHKTWKELGTTSLTYFVFPIWLFLRFFFSEERLQKISIFKEDAEESEVAAWIGGGDLRLAIFMGILLGVKQGIIALFVAYIVGAIIGILAMIIKKKDRKSMIPFGPFLVIGTFVAFFWGKELWQWYMSLVF